MFVSGHGGVNPFVTLPAYAQKYVRGSSALAVILLRPLGPPLFPPLREWCCEAVQDGVWFCGAEDNMQEAVMELNLRDPA